MEGFSIQYEQPRSSLAVVENQKRFQWVNNNEFYSMIPAPYLGFYQNWVKFWLQWADGFVPFIHGGQYGLLSTGIGTNIVDLVTDKVVGSGLMYKNARKPQAIKLNNEGKPVGEALDFFTGEFELKSDFANKVKQAIKYAYAGGFSILKLNVNDGNLWVDSLRADRFYLDITQSGKIRRCISVLSFYNDMTADNTQGKKYGLVEERYYAKIGMFSTEIPVIEYKIYDSSVQIQYFDSIKTNYIAWEQLPGNVRKAFKEEYGNIKLNKPQALNGFTDLGVYLFKGSSDISNVPQIALGESILANITTYLYEYDHCNTAFNTDIYLAKGRVLLPKYMQKANSNNGSASGFDDFIFTKMESANPEEQKPEPVQFNLRSSEWKETRNYILECIASGIKVSASSLATHLQGGSMRTAREVSAEEDATTLFVENARMRFTPVINKAIAQVLRFYGFIDDVEVRWSRAGMTNQTVLVETLTKAVQGGLISPQKAHALFNFDDDEEQQLEDFKKVEENQAKQQQSLFGGGEF
jgi:hypothetical protein